MSMKSQRRGFRRRIRVIALIAALLAACALLTQCTAGNSTADKDSDVVGMKDSASPEATAEPMPEPTATSEPTETPIPSDLCIDDKGNIPKGVKPIYPPTSFDSKSYCITRNEEGKLVCQMWERLSLRREWRMPEEILDAEDITEMSVYQYTDIKDGGDIFVCLLDSDYSVEVLGPEQKLRAFYMKKAGKELLIVYNSHSDDIDQSTYTTPDGKVYRIYSGDSMPMQVYCWQLEEGIYIDHNSKYLIYDKNGTVIGYPTEEGYDGYTMHFAEPFDNPTIPEWNDVEQ